MENREVSTGLEGKGESGSRDVLAAIFKHKQHIALEVRNVICSELAVIMNSQQMVAEGCARGLMQMENGVQLELKEIQFRISVIEGKNEEILEKLRNFESVLGITEEKLLNENKKNWEKNLELEQILEFLKDDLKGLNEKLINIFKDLRGVKEKYLEKEKDVISNEIYGMVNEVKNALELYRYEAFMRINNESLQFNEKLSQMHEFIEKSVLQMLKNLQSTGKPPEKVDRDKELIDHFNEGLSKCFNEIGNMKGRIEKVEERDRIVSEFIKSRKN